MQLESLNKAQNGWGYSWIALSLSLAIHVWDEAAHDFLSWYNPAVLAIKEQAPFLPLPTFTFEVWLTGLILAVVVLLSLSIFAFRRAKWFRAPSYAFAILMIGNGLLHIATSLYYEKLMPGLYSSPLLIISSVWVLIELRKK